MFGQKDLSASSNNDSSRINFSDSNFNRCNNIPNFPKICTIVGTSIWKSTISKVLIL
ncbi:hypothetical protein C2G38_2108184 [Gigaspora rosea]|uniref:Uncharacterized protein n=1 Tax=Gigaspora rosea TaxID=44941 RepID=A0A397ULI2_9GLOM|nr:hypothetical protein C2G38_2108184 [Gigaspora rosea]